jgi:sigma-B regulation protein RsbU (phosphoserine phosphatase)
VDSGMIRPGSLQQRLLLFMILPVALLLVLMGGVGFFYARNLMLSQWQEAAILRLQRAAHQIDMLLGQIGVRVEGLDNAAESEAPQEVFDWTVRRLGNVDGVDRVTVAWENEVIEQKGNDDMAQMHMRRHARSGGRRMASDARLRMMRFERTRTREISLPRFDTQADHRTMSIIYDLLDEKGHRLGHMEVVVKFDFLIRNITETGWWQSNKAFLVENDGEILVCTVGDDRTKLGETNDPLELKTLETLSSKASGTIMGEGHPPEEVSGFYKLTEAPWAIVMIAPGNKILEPIIHFRTFYLVFVTVVIFFIVFLIRFMSGKTVSSIQAVSRAANRVSRGDYDIDLTAETRDEVGDLIRSFNEMVVQLKERRRLKKDMGLAMEVQQNLLPRQAPEIEGLDVAGRSIYCEETGGDYFDFLPVADSTGTHLGLAVGDVVGHGVSSALLMTSGRALLRSRLSQPGNLADIIADINRLLYKDTAESGSFMTLFCGIVDMNSRRLTWVRAGHDPAFFFDPTTGEVSELEGKGAALGVDQAFHFEENTIGNLSAGQLLLIGTDGIWETQSESGEMFGKERVVDFIKKHARLPAADLTGLLINRLETFRGSNRQEDDITLIVAKVTG